MQTTGQREAEFRNDLRILLEKHGAEIYAIDGKPYGFSGSLCHVTIHPVYASGKLKENGCDFDL